MPSELELRKALAKFAGDSGYGKDAVARMFGIGSEDTTFTQRAQERLDQLMRDRDFVNKLNNGDTEALDKFNALTVAVVWQQGVDRDAQIATTKAAIEADNTERAAVAARESSQTSVSMPEIVQITVADPV